VTKKYLIVHKTLVFAVTLANFYCAIVIKKTVIFRVLQASGVDLTTIFNSICNSAINSCIIRIETGRPFNEVADQWTYGDDLLLNCPSVSRKRMWELAKKMFDHTRTDPDKKGAETDTSIFKAYFLQRRFVQDVVMKCPLNIESITTMLQWIFKPKFPVTQEMQFHQNCLVALMELSRHPRELYEKYQTEINLYLPRPITMTWEYAQLDVCNKCLFTT